MHQERQDPVFHSALQDLERAAAEDSHSEFVLRLFITGTTPKSIRAISNLRTICDEHLAGHFDLEVIDLYQQPELAAGNHIVAAPTLIKQLPAPLRRIIGDLSDTERVLVGLDIKPKTAAGAPKWPDG